MGGELKFNATYELCAGKKVLISTKKRFKVQRDVSNVASHIFTPLIGPELASRGEKWIIGGQDACHVSHYNFWPAPKS